MCMSNDCVYVNRLCVCMHHLVGSVGILTHNQGRAARRALWVWSKHSHMQQARARSAGAFWVPRPAARSMQDTGDGCTIQRRHGAVAVAEALAEAFGCGAHSGVNWRVLVLGDSGARCRKDILWWVYGCVLCVFV